MNEELYHYGVKGMKWGIRRDKYKKSNRRSKNKQSSESREGSNGFHLTSKQKKAIAVGATVVGAALVTYGAYKLGAFDRFKSSGVKAVNNIMGTPSLKIDPKKATQVKAPSAVSKPKIGDIGSALKGANPSGSKTNCRACSMAFSLRMRGIDAEALGNVQGGSLSDAIKSSFKNARVSEMYDPTKEKVNRYILRKFEEGSHGVMSGELKSPMGTFQHAFNWVVKDGAVQYVDGQNGMTDASRYLDWLSSNKSVEISRLDNLEIDTDGLDRFVKRR